MTLSSVVYTLRLLAIFCGCLCFIICEVSLMRIGVEYNYAEAYLLTGDSYHFHKGGEEM